MFAAALFHKIWTDERIEIMNRLKVRNSLLLLLTASIWGVAFVAQSVGMNYVGPFTFNFIRCILGGIVLIPCIWLLNRINGQAGNVEEKSREDRKRRTETLLREGFSAESFFAWAAIFSSLEFSIPQWEKQALLQHFILLLSPF